MIDRSSHIPGNAMVGMPHRPVTQSECECSHQVEATITNSQGATERVYGMATWDAEKNDWEVMLADGRTLHLDPIERKPDAQG